MANALIGALRVVLGMDSAAFNDGIGAAQKRAAGFSKSMKRMGQSMTRAGTRLSAGLTAPLVGLAYKSVAAQREQERAIASVTTALQSMGDGAGYTLGQLENMASAIQDKSLYGDEEILSKVTANLLTFGNVQGDVLKRAQDLAVDLSARLGTDLQSSAIMLGKALNDPVKGLTALTRVGVTFTEQQQEQIKSMAKAGDVAGAQALMLAELEKQYKGQAEALAKTDSGRVTQALNAIGDASEKIGAIILPIMADIADHVKRLAEQFQQLSPDTQKFIVVAGSLAAAIGPVVAALGLMMTALAPMAGAILAIVSPIGLLAVGIAAAGVAVYQNWDAIKEEFPAIAAVIEGAISSLVAHFQRIKEAVLILFDGIKTQLRLAVTVVENLLSGDFQGAWDAAKEMVRNAVTTILAVIDTLVGDLARAMLQFGLDLAARLGEGLMAGIEAVRQFGADILAALAEMLASIIEAALNIGHEIVEGIKRGLKEKWQGLKDQVTGLGSGIAQSFKDVLGIKSPSRLFKTFGGFIVQGLVQGLQGGIGLVSQAVGKLSGLFGMDGLNDATKGTETTMKKLGSAASSTLSKIGKLFGEGLRGAKSFKEVLGGVLQTMARVLAQQAQVGVVNAFGGGKSIGGQLAGAVFGGLLGFANGGSFEVGGAGGIDSQVVAFRASPNERVTITKPGHEFAGVSASSMHVVIEASEDLRVVAADAGRAATVEVVQGNNRAMYQSSRRNGK